MNSQDIYALSKLEINIMIIGKILSRKGGKGRGERICLARDECGTK